MHGILLIDKPRGITSHDVVALVRRQLQIRKVGHAGTLDPAAEGLMIIGVGRATKLLGTLTHLSKRYLAHVVLGCGSVSGDLEGPLIENTSTSTPLPIETIRAALARFLGDIEQVPPTFSAIKLDGKPLYRYARQGQAVDVPARHVQIAQLELLNYCFPNVYLDIRCSAGTYIRSLARDLGEVLGTPAYLHTLVRAEIDHFALNHAWSLAEIQQALAPNTFEQFALHPMLAEPSSVVLRLGPDAANAWYDGLPAVATIRSSLERAHAFQTDGSWLGVAARVGDFWQPKVVVHR